MCNFKLTSMLKYNGQAFPLACRVVKIRCLKLGISDANSKSVINTVQGYRSEFTEINLSRTSTQGWVLAAAHKQNLILKEM